MSIIFNSADIAETMNNGVSNVTGADSTITENYTNVVQHGIKIDMSDSEKTISGTPPLSFSADGTPLLDYLISGNMSQTGTPTPQNPIQPQECGDMTANLWDGIIGIDNVILNQNGNLTSNNAYALSEFIKVEPNTTYIYHFYHNAVESSRATYTITEYNNMQTIITPLSLQQITEKRDYDIIFTTQANTAYIRISWKKAFDEDLMLIASTTALPYEPYGYKISISSGGVNLFDYSAITTGYRMQWASGNPYADDTAIMSDFIPVTEGDYALSMGVTILGYAADKSYIGVYRLEKTWEKRSSNLFSAFTVLSNSNIKYVRLLTYSTYDPITNTLMLNHGSTPLPYEPYIEPTETNIYLGEVPTTRKIKKSVLDGTEAWGEDTSNYFINLSGGNAIPNSATLCTHTESGVVVNNTGTALFFKKTVFVHDSIADFQAYLQQQYANGTPVTIWYVLATPETSTVNEPLMKIGDYADSVSYSQTGITIPTVSGNNTLDVQTTPKPSNISITYKGR